MTPNPLRTALPARSGHHSAAWAIAITGVALFMASLDNLVVTTALPVIRTSLHAGLTGLEWTVNAYTLTFAVLLLTGAALGDRFGRRRIFVLGLLTFTLASAAAALAPDVDALIAARAVQGAGGAMLMPLSLTLLSAAVPPERRSMALGLWGAIGGLAVAIGPLVGGAITGGVSWQWIFWLNVPIGLILAPLAMIGLAESRGAIARLDTVGVVLASTGLLGIVAGLVRGPDHGWDSWSVTASFVLGAAGLVAFVVWERRTASPMLPLRLFRNRGFTAVNLVAFLMSFGMFGSIFLLAQFLQTVQHHSPFEAGLLTLPWTGMPILVTPIVGRFADRVGARRLLVAGMVLQGAGLAWLAIIIAPRVAYALLVPAFVVSGIGMSLFFIPVASVVLASVRPAEEGVASGTNNAMRELGGVFGIAVLGSIFSASGGYASGSAFVAGLLPAVAAGAAVVALGAVAAGFIQNRRAGGEAGVQTPDEEGSAVPALAGGI